MKTLKLKTALNDIFQAGLENARMEVSVIVDGQTVTIFTSDQVFYELANNYDTYVVCISEIFAPTTAAFINLYSDYRANTKNQLYRAFAALNAEYNPVNNYDMIETSADGKKLDKTTVTPTGGTETKTYRAGLNSTGDGVQADFMEMYPKDGAKTETEHGNTESMSFDGTTLSGYHEANEHFLKRSGNIGVTEASAMVTHELELRKRDLLREWVKEFIDRYCYTIGGGENERYNL